MKTLKIVGRLTPVIPYTPDTWTDSQRELHEARTLDEALHHASCLAGGWYLRPVAVDYHVTPENDERYMLRPAEVAPLAEWTPCYEIKAVR